MNSFFTKINMFFTKFSIKAVGNKFINYLENLHPHDAEDLFLISLGIILGVLILPYYEYMLSYIVLYKYETIKEISVFLDGYRGIYKYVSKFSVSALVIFIWHNPVGNVIPYLLGGTFNAVISHTGEGISMSQKDPLGMYPFMIKHFQHWFLPNIIEGLKLLIFTFIDNCITFGNNYTYAFYHAETRQEKILILSNMIVRAIFFIIFLVFIILYYYFKRDIDYYIREFQYALYEENIEQYKRTFYKIFEIIIEFIKDIFS